MSHDRTEFPQDFLDPGDKIYRKQYSGSVVSIVSRANERIQFYVGEFHGYAHVNEWHVEYSGASYSAWISTWFSFRSRESQIDRKARKLANRWQDFVAKAHESARIVQTVTRDYK